MTAQPTVASESRLDSEPMMAPGEVHRPSLSFRHRPLYHRPLNFCHLCCRR